MFKVGDKVMITGGSKQFLGQIAEVQKVDEHRFRIMMCETKALLWRNGRDLSRPPKSAVGDFKDAADGCYTVFVNSYSWKKSLDVSVSATVQDVLMRVGAGRLTLAGEVLAPDKTLADVGVGPQTTLEFQPIALPCSALEEFAARGEMREKVEFAVRVLQAEVQEGFAPLVGEYHGGSSVMMHLRADGSCAVAKRQTVEHCGVWFGVPSEDKVEFRLLSTSDPEGSIVDSTFSMDGRYLVYHSGDRLGLPREARYELQGDRVIGTACY
eukprot:TRINITY_DN47649_c0_g1_i1.p1 TRINITY_DN47649_c0_g1~~TRINITY_DN47649_c0_g1_i1.p1  ORF type:complete len:268 (+),score=25.08 TRINITY_DN47649_c0_g1_i1:60-863(+)